MKKLIYILSYVSALLLVPVHITAQTTSCNDLDFTIAKTNITNSTCLSNGEIAVTIAGDRSNISSLQYGLSSTSGFTINPQPDSILRNIPPGTYSLTVRAFCKENLDYSVVKTASNLVVGGNYKAPQASFNISGSRKSYPDCGTGIIVLNVTDGNGNFTFTVVSAPAGVTTPATVTATKNGTVYTLAGQNWPAGSYQILVEDGCYSAMATFTLDAVSGFPAFMYESPSGFRPDVDNTQGSCNYVKWYAYSSAITSGQSNFNQDYLTYFNAGMYEIGIAPAGTNVSAVTNWTTWTSNGSTPFFNLSPNNISEFYGTNSIAVYIRLKGCPNTYKSFTTNIKSPITNGGSTYNCDNYIRTIYPWTDYDGVVCYPLTLTVTKNSDGSTIYTKSNWLYNVNYNDKITLDYGVDYTATFTDQNGKTFTTSLTSITPTRSFYISSTNTTYCNGYTFYYNVSLSYKPASCYEWPVKVTITDPNNVVVQQVNLTSTTSTTTPILEYNKTYTLKAENADGTLLYTTTRNVSLPAKTYMLSLYTVNSCSVNTGSLQVSTSSTTPWPAGTTFTITGPAGYTTQTYTTTSSSSYYYLPETKLPPGLYTLTVNNDCGNTYTATYNCPGIYNYTNFGYTSEQTCAGIKIKPTGQVTYMGSATTTYFRLLNGPAGYDKTVISPGGSFVLSTPGTYVLAITNSNTSATCYLATDTINYTAPPLSLDPNVTSAYVCVGGSTGNISVRGINGVTPYTYALLDGSSTVYPNSVSADGTAYFHYGQVGETYTIRVSDQCGNSFDQQVTVSDLTTARIVYSLTNPVCTGSTIELKCITLGTTTYNWSGPNNYANTIQNPAITNAQVSMTGWYKVEVTPEFCGTSVKDSIYIQVYPPLAAGAINGNQEICVRTEPSVLSSETTGGNGNYTYQWQLSEDGVSNWTNISGATGTTYLPPVQIKSGVYYYRKVTTDTCGTVNSNAISVVVKACYIPVNPNIKSKGKK